ncbi:MAG: V-type ATPase subunit [Candidatus Woesearchaeota archaeon]
MIQELEKKEIKYSFSPYTYARICAMKGLLLKKNDYEKLFKLELSEITKFLQEQNYNQEINELGLKYKGLKLIELSLNKNLTRVLSKLREISDESIKPLVDLYLKRYDFYNLKTLIRAKNSNMKFEEIEDLLIPLGSLKYNFLKKIYNKSIKYILLDSKIVNLNDLKDALNKFENPQEEKKDLSEIENILDFYYYNETIKLVKKISTQGQLFKEFFEYEIDLYNIKLILKKIAFNLENKTIEKYIIRNLKKLTELELNNLLKTENYETFLNIFKKTFYGKIFALTDFNLLKYETEFENFLLKKRNLLLHQNPLSVDTILGFMFQKETEIKNLKVIVKSKSLQLDQEYYEKLIVV